MKEYISFHISHHWYFSLCQLLFTCFFHMLIKFHMYVKLKVVYGTSFTCFSHSVTFHTFISQHFSQHKKFHMHFTYVSHSFHMVCHSSELVCQFYKELCCLNREHLSPQPPHEQKKQQ